MGQRIAGATLADEKLCAVDKVYPQGEPFFAGMSCEKQLTLWNIIFPLREEAAQMEVASGRAAGLPQP